MDEYLATQDNDGENDVHSDESEDEQMTTVKRAKQRIDHYNKISIMEKRDKLSTTDPYGRYSDKNRASMSFDENENNGKMRNY